MVETITPVVYGGRNRAYWLSLTTHVLGAAFAAALFGAALGGAGALLRAPWNGVGWLALGGVALVYALREAVNLSVPVFDRRIQVPQWWRDFYSPPVASFLYGAGLGIGFFTFLKFGTYVVVCAAAFLSGNPLLGAVLCGCFGLTRGLSILVSCGGGPPGGVVDTLDRLGASPGPRYVNAAVLAVVVLAAMISA